MRDGEVAGERDALRREVFRNGAVALLADDVAITMVFLDDDDDVVISGGTANAGSKECGGAAQRRRRRKKWDTADTKSP